MDRVRKIIGIDKLERSYLRKYNGRGIGVAILDTGERVIIMSS